MGKLPTVPLWFLVAATLAGCLLLPPIPIPLPAYGVRGEVVERLRSGLSTRADAHALLGEPNRLASPRHEVWELAHAPFRMLMAGYDNILYPADETPSRSTVAVEYDAEGTVAGWRWEGRILEPANFAEPEQFRDHVHGASEPEPAPAAPFAVVPWRAQAIAVSPDGARVALMAAGRQIRIVEIPAGRPIAASGDWPTICGTGEIALAFVETGIVSLPGSRSQPGGLCRWHEEGGALVAVPATRSEMVEDLQGARMSRLLGRFAIAQRQDGRVGVWDLAGAPLTVFDPEALKYRPTSIAITPDGSLVSLELAVEPDAPPELVLRHLARGTDRDRILRLPGPAHQPQPLAALALAPAGDLLAIHRWTHVEVWRVGGPEAPPVLEAALPLPPPTMAGGLGFSADGKRLVAEASIVLVWETEGWRPIVRTTGRTRSNSPRLQLTPDGSHIATPSGLMRIVPQNGPVATGL